MTSALLHAFKQQQLPLRCPMPHCKAQLQLQPAVQLLEQQVPGSSALAAKAGRAALTKSVLASSNCCWCHVLHAVLICSFASRSFSSVHGVVGDFPVPVTVTQTRNSHQQFQLCSCTVAADTSC